MSSSICTKMLLRPRIVCISFSMQVFNQARLTPSGMICPPRVVPSSGRTLGRGGGMPGYIRSDSLIIALCQRLVIVRWPDRSFVTSKPNPAKLYVTSCMLRLAMLSKAPTSISGARPVCVRFRKCHASMQVRSCQTLQIGEPATHRRNYQHQVQHH